MENVTSVETIEVNVEIDGAITTETIDAITEEEQEIQMEMVMNTDIVPAEELVANINKMYAKIGEYIKQEKYKKAEKLTWKLRDKMELIPRGVEEYKKESRLAVEFVLEVGEMIGKTKKKKLISGIFKIAEKKFGKDNIKESQIRLIGQKIYKMKGKRYEGLLDVIANIF